MEIRVPDTPESDLPPRLQKAALAIGEFAADRVKNNRGVSDISARIDGILEQADESSATAE